MGATSVTGVSGPGESHGLYKPELHCGGCGCGCGKANCNETTTPPSSIGCYIVNRAGGGTTIRSGGGLTLKGC